MRLERDPPIEISPQPASAAVLPVDRPFRAGRLAPAPAGAAPPLAATVAAVLHELGEASLRDGRAGDPERRELHRVGPLLVVEHEGLAGLRAEQERAAGNGDVSGQVAAARDRRRGVGEPRRGVPERLARERHRLEVHVLVEDAQRDEVRIRVAALDERPDAGFDVPQVCGGLREVRERQLPARVVRDGGGVVEGVAVGTERRPPGRVAQHPALLEPGDVAELPEGRVHDGEPRSQELRVGQRRRELQRATSGIGDRFGERLTHGQDLAKRCRAGSNRVEERSVLSATPRLRRLRDDRGTRFGIGRP